MTQVLFQNTYVDSIQPTDNQGLIDRDRGEEAITKYKMNTLISKKSCHSA